MAGRLRFAAKLDLDAAVAAGHEPKAGVGGVGLSLPIPGKRAARILLNRHGLVTAAGAYYYDQSGKEAPTSGFDYNQQPTRAGQRHVIRLLDGTARRCRSGTHGPTHSGLRRSGASSSRRRSIGIRSLSLCWST